MELAGLEYHILAFKLHVIECIIYAYSTFKNGSACIKITLGGTIFLILDWLVSMADNFSRSYPCLPKISFH